MRPRVSCCQSAAQPRPASPPSFFREAQFPNVFVEAGKRSESHVIQSSGASMRQQLWLWPVDGNLTFPKWNAPSQQRRPFGPRYGVFAGFSPILVRGDAFGFQKSGSALTHASGG